MGDMVLSASTACFAGATMEAALATAADMGFRAVELTLWGEAFHSVGRLPGMWWREAGEAERRVLRQAIEAFEVVDGHLPFVNCPLVSANKFVEELGRELIAEALDALAGLGAGNRQRRRQAENDEGLLAGKCHCGNAPHSAATRCRGRHAVARRTLRRGRASRQRRRCGIMHQSAPKQHRRCPSQNAPN